jgi:MFS family permease
VSDTERRSAQNRNLRVVAVSQFLNGLLSRITQAVWQPFALSLGAPMSTVGLLESIGGPSGIVTALIQPLGGWLSDRLGRKPIIVAGALASFLAIGFYVLASTTTAWHWLVAGMMLLGIGLISLPARDSLIAESVSARRRGMAYSIMMTALIAPGIFAPPLGGFIADRWGFTPVFASRWVLEAVQPLLLAWFLRETLQEAKGELSWTELRGMFARVFWPPRELRGLYWSMAIDSFAWALGSLLIFGMLTETYGFTTVQLGVMASVFSASWVVAQLPVGRLIDRFGCKPFLVLSEIMGLSLLVAWLFARSFSAFVALHAYFGFTAATWIPTQQALFANSVPDDQRGEALGRVAAFRSLIAFPAPYIGGLLFDRLGFAAPILANLVGATIALVAIIAWVREPSSLEPPPTA